ncbi:ORF10R [black bullhead herpesvirus]|uniref:ORF10L n=1 Tax=black bullhead herpesvirus TaxID=508441 RepID=A0A2H5AJM5_9VIRU|nr:ORF10L [black bullhead herpesvirus]YP_009447915.1 ORF10R [black bullhead herpesvirus]AUG72267.1 ORF10L [black bullhead herpesvirus]AUG72337.1 ORF10R [black bullhead herpesvirus]
MKNCVCATLFVGVITLLGVAVVLSTYWADEPLVSFDLVETVLGRGDVCTQALRRLDQIGGANATDAIRVLVEGWLISNATRGEDLVVQDRFYRRMVQKTRVEIFVIHGVVALLNVFGIAFIIIYSCARATAKGARSRPPIVSPSLAATTVSV